MVVVPVASPVTNPDVAPTVATVVFVDAHVPPGELDSCRVSPTPTVFSPVIGSGVGLTVIWFPVLEHPLDRV